MTPELKNWATHLPTYRHFHMSDGEPNVADPCAVIVFAETPHAKPAEGVLIATYWTGWRARLIRYLINRWMPARSGELTHD
jgi:hypothetical protein